MCKPISFFVAGLMLVAPTLAFAGLFDDLNKLKTDLDSVAKKFQGGNLNPETTTQQVNPSSDLRVQSLQSTKSNKTNVNAIASGNKTLNFICKPLASKGLYAKLGKH